MVRGRLASTLQSRAKAAFYARRFTSPHMSFVFLSRTPLSLHNMVIIFPHETLPGFGVLQSRTHELWARFFASSLKDDLRYTPSDCFRTFPFPEDFRIAAILEAAAHAYHDHRAALMVARNEGMTKTYNRFHDPRRDRRGHRAAARIARRHGPCGARAYGWNDLADRAEPIFLDETNEDDHTYQGRLFWPSAFRDEVLARLLALNAERAAAERAAGLAPAGAESEEPEESDA